MTLLKYFEQYTLMTKHLALQCSIASAYKCYICNMFWPLRSLLDRYFYIIATLCCFFGVHFAKTGLKQFTIIIEFWWNELQVFPFQAFFLSYM
jgi:hypothetical protein